MSENDPKDKHSKLFLELVISLQISALQFLGKLVNPQTQKIERNLEGASASIDMLDMLAARTRGNLDPGEARFLDETLNHLKLNYLEELNRSSEDHLGPAEKPPPPSQDDKKDSTEPPKEPPGDKDDQAES